MRRAVFSNLKMFMAITFLTYFVSNLDEREDLSLLSDIKKPPHPPIMFNGKPSSVGTNSIVVRKYSSTEKSANRSSISKTFFYSG